MTFLNGLGAPKLDYTIAQLFENVRPEDGSALVEAIAQCEDYKHNCVVTESGIYNISIDRVFGRFLFKLSNRIDSKILQEIIVLLVIWRNCINSSYCKF